MAMETQPSITASTDTPDSTGGNDTRTGNPAPPSKFALSKQNIFDKYSNAVIYTDQLNDPFPEFQRIARKKPYPGLARKFPRVAEGSTAAFIRQKPRQLIQKTPTGKVNNDDAKEWLNLVAQWALDKEIIPNAKEDYDVFEKAQSMMEQGLTVGCSVTTAPFYNHSGVWSPDMTMQFWGDVIVPKGYKSIRSMPYTFIRGWWAPERIDMVLADPKAAQDGFWDVKALKDVKEWLSTKDVKSETPVEKDRGLPEDGVEIVIAHQDGVKAPIFTFHPQSQTILRTKINPDPRGKKNVQTMYGLIDGTNPFGYSLVEFVGDWQNLMDNDVQAYQYNRAYNVDPALIKRGQIGDGDLHPGAEFETTDENASIETIELTSQALESFPSTHEWQKGVLMNLLNNPTSTDDPEAPLGKTPKGITIAGKQISTDDLTLIQHIHDWFQEWAETAVNLYFAERHGKQNLTLDDQTVNQLKQLADEDKFEIKFLTGNVLEFDFDQTLPILHFEVDGGSSKLQDEASQLEALQVISEDISNDQELLSLTGPLMKAKLYNKKVALSGIHDSDELLIDIKKLEQQLEAQQQQQEQQQSEQQARAESAKAPSVSISFKDLPGFGKLQAAAYYGIQLRPQDVGLNPDFSAAPQPVDAAALVKPHHPSNPGLRIASPLPQSGAEPPEEFMHAVQNLKDAGLPEVLIPHAIQALTEHVPLEDIVAAVQGGA